MAKNYAICCYETNYKTCSDEIIKHASGLLLSSVQIIKLIVAIISISTIMFLTYQISIWRSVILAMLFLAMAWGIDYVVYVGNSHILSQAGDVKSKYEMQGGAVDSNRQDGIISDYLIYKAFLLSEKNRDA